MKFHFTLAPMDQIAPWTVPSEKHRKHLHWFGLTDGSYWIDVAGHPLLRYSDALCEHWATTYPDASAGPFVDYYIVRLWEDILEMLPAVLNPVPEDLARLVAPDGAWATWQGLQEWSERAEQWMDGGGEERWDALVDAKGWWGERQLDSAYLRAGFGLWLWRTGDTVHVRWDNEDTMLDDIPAWAEISGESSLSVSDFVDAVRSFDARFLAAMGERVGQVRAHWDRTDVEIDPDALEREQRERATWLENALGRTHNSDWDRARAALAQVEAGMP